MRARARFQVAMLPLPLPTIHLPGRDFSGAMRARLQVDHRPHRVGSGFRVHSAGFEVQGAGFRVHGSRFTVGCRVQGSGCRVWGSGAGSQGGGWGRILQEQCVLVFRSTVNPYSKGGGSGKWSQGGGRAGFRRSNACTFGKGSGFGV